jgi:hypothetical protein
MPSTVISYFTYFPSSETLRIAFVSGIVYDYINVPVSIYRDMKEAYSKGTYFNKYIKDKFEFIKRPQSTDDARPTELSS